MAASVSNRVQPSPLLLPDQAVSSRLNWTNTLFGNPAYLTASALLGTLFNLLWSTVQASRYVELRDWKDGPATHRLEQIFA